MSSSISTTTSQQQLFQQVQNTPKPDTTEKTKDQSTSAASTPVTKQAATTPVNKPVLESASTRNSDGTFGSRHTLTAPYNPSKASTRLESAKASSESSVNVKI